MSNELMYELVQYYIINFDYLFDYKFILPIYELVVKDFFSILGMFLPQDLIYRFKAPKEVISYVS